MRQILYLPGVVDEALDGGILGVSIAMKRDAAVHHWPVDPNTPRHGWGRRPVEIGVGQDDDGVLASHLAPGRPVS